MCLGPDFDYLGYCHMYSSSNMSLDDLSENEIDLPFKTSRNRQ